MIGKLPKAKLPKGHKPPKTDEEMLERLDEYEALSKGRAQEAVKQRDMGGAHLEYAMQAHIQRQREKVLAVIQARGGAA